MSDPAARLQRASALEEKRRKLEELKKKREGRTGNNDTTSTTTRIQATANLEEYIDDLLKDNSTVSGTNVGSEVNQSSPTFDTNVNHVIPASDVANGDVPQSMDTLNENGGMTHNVSTKVSTSSYTDENILRKKVETFSISTQTDDDLEIDDNDDDDEDDENERKKDKKKKVTEQNELHKDAQTQEQEEEVKVEIPKVLSPNEVEKEVTKQPFSLFINTASKKVERLLGTQSTTMLSDLFMDYDAIADSNDNDLITIKQKGLIESKEDTTFIQSRQIYECPKWTHHRDVTDMDWSPIHRELLLSTYHMTNTSSTATSPSTTINSLGQQIAVSSLKPSSRTDILSSSLTPRSGDLLSDGLALIWSPMLPNRPEHVFTCGAPVTCGRFHPTDPSLIIGGCESGQLVIWDIRSGRLPVQKSSIPTIVSTSTSSSSINQKGHHAHSITSMQVLDGGLSLVTASTDGRLNFWSITNLRDPAESIQVGDSISCFTIVPDTETIVVGDEHGTMYTVMSPNATNAATTTNTTNTTSRPTSRSSSPVPPSSVTASSSNTGQRVSRRQVKKFDVVDDENLGHYGMITSISAKSRSNVKNTSTSYPNSNNNNPSQQHHHTGTSKGYVRGCGGLLVSSGVDWTIKIWAPAYHERPILSWLSHSYDYMSDVAWSTTHPSLFATASSNGTIGLWNLASAFDEPITGPDGIRIVDTELASGIGLNKLKWSADGRRLAVASSDRVYMLNISDDIIRTKGDEEMKVMNQLLSRGLL